MHAGVIGLFAFMAAAAALAQPAPIPYRELPSTLDSGVRTAPPAAGRVGPQPVLVWHELVHTDAAWLRLFFRNVDVGPGGFLRIVSMADRAEQILDARGLEDWQNSSALFNGDAVEIQLHASPGTRARVALSRIWAGERRSARGAETICGATDDRVSADDRAVGRVVPFGCTAWLISNGAILSAGHCNDPGFAVLQFHVPQSTCDGTIVHPPPHDQYPVLPASIVTQPGPVAVGNDWMVFRVRGTSSPSDPNVFQREYFRLTQTPYPKGAPLRVTGFGVDSTPPGCQGGNDSNSQTEQSDSGPFTGQTGSGSSVTIRYRVDTMGGNSGSPVIINGSRTAIGIHTTGGCKADPGSANQGTGFANTLLATTLAQWNGKNVIHVDAGSPESVEDGKLFTPYRTVSAAVAAAPAGSTISIAGGSYDRVLTLTTAVTLIAPSGLVILGKDPALK